MATPGIPPNISIPGVVGSIPTGYLLGRVSPGTGPVQLVRFSDIGSGASGTGKAGSGSSGTVTSVSLTAPAFLTVGGSPITTSGTLTLTLATQVKNKVFAGPTTGADAAPTFRTLVAADLPALGANPTATASDTANNGTATTYMRSDASPAIQKASTTLFGVAKADGTTISATGGVLGVIPGGITGTQADFAIDGMLFGDGADGDVTVTTAIFLSRDMYYHNLTISGSGSINTNGWKIHVAGTLDISAAGANSIWDGPNNSTSPTTGRNGGTAISTSGASGAGVQNTNTCCGGVSGSGSGANGAAGFGAGSSASPAGSSSTRFQGGVSGDGSAGGSGVGGAGGAKTNAAGSIVTQWLPNRLDNQYPWFVPTGATWNIISGGQPGPGGSSGGGDNAGSLIGGGGGGGGLGGGGMYIAARTIARGGSTAVSAINSDGGKGGGGFTVASGNRGGGGGGAGGGGGWLILIFRLLTGSAATNAVSANGGDGGNGGNGSGTGTGADGGGAGQGGRMDIWNIGAGTFTQVLPSAAVAVAGGAHSGTTGGTGATHNAQAVTL